MPWAVSGPQVDLVAVLLDRPHVGLEHEVEAARRRQRPGVHRALEAEALDDRVVHHVGVGEALRCPGSSSRRKRRRHVVHSTSGSLKLATWPEVTQTWGAMMMLASRPTMSSRSWTMDRHQARLTLFLSSTPSWPVVPDRVDAAVDLRAREDEAAPLGQRDDRLEVGYGRSRIVGRGGLVGGGHVGLLGHRRAGLLRLSFESVSRNSRTRKPRPLSGGSLQWTVDLCVAFAMLAQAMRRVRLSLPAAHLHGIAERERRHGRSRR